jgi:hypothetical protein
VGIALLDLTIHNRRGKKSEEKRNVKSTASTDIKQQVSTSISAATKLRDPTVMA